MKNSLLVMVLFLFLTTVVPVKEVSSKLPDGERAEEGVQVIPDEAIRLRILANSDQDKDQEIKLLVRDEVNAYLADLVQDVDDIERARKMIREHIPQIEAIIAKVLEKAGADSEFTAEYDTNVSFPMKVYDTYVYPPGEYEAVLITLGEGEGSNWWCVLFPPLCFLDFSNGTTVEDEDGEESQEAAEELELAEDSVVLEEETIEEEEATEEEEETTISFFLWEWLGLS